MSGGADPMERVRAEIDKMHASIQEANHYDLLGIERGAQDAEIMSAYRQLAKKWHVDQFSRHGSLGDHKVKVQEISTAINDAKRTLQDAQLRADYDAELDGASAQAMVDIFEADKYFLRGKGILSRGGYKGAYDLFKQAHDLNPEDIDIRAYLLFTEFLQMPKSDAGRADDYTKAQEIFKELDEINEKNKNNECDWLLVFLGQVAIGMGKRRDAKFLFTEARTLNPNNHDAKRQLRLLDMRAERKKEAQKKSFFSSLLEKLGVSTE